MVLLLLPDKDPDLSGNHVIDAVPQTNAITKVEEILPASFELTKRINSTDANESSMAYLELKAMMATDENDVQVAEIASSALVGAEWGRVLVLSDACLNHRASNKISDALSKKVNETDAMRFSMIGEFFRHASEEEQSLFFAHAKTLLEATPDLWTWSKIANSGIFKAPYVSVAHRTFVLDALQSDQLTLAEKIAAEIAEIFDAEMQQAVMTDILPNFKQYDAVQVAGVFAHNPKVLNDWKVNLNVEPLSMIQDPEVKRRVKFSKSLYTPR